jgi:hypothetical protein
MQNSSANQSLATLDRQEVIYRLNAFLEKECGAKADANELIYCSWPEAFGSSCGPFPGIGGQAITTFRMEAWAWEQWAVVFCNGRIVEVGEFQIGAKYGKR